ncbi:MAG: iron-containing alcohol dehydrogenase [Vicinamibacteria bacterium]|jgi:NADP-dependent alcohol dehydrogenase|nr:iron-containing alcohol dehydrogenase [Vicinamibacteria bacterium]
MNSFTYHNPVRIVFGKGKISELRDLAPARKRILLTYGGGSIKSNGVFDQVKRALQGRQVVEFGGIEPNPRYETLMRAVEIARREKIRFLLAVGGGSVIDGTKFIAAAIPFAHGDPWRILLHEKPVEAAVPLGCVLTLPATGSEMNTFAVISRESTQEKLVFGSPHVSPVFSILDPETTYSLPARQLVNGLVDTYVHVLEQYATYDIQAPLQARQAEALLQTLIEIAPQACNAAQHHYDARASFMWCATQALNGLISVGVPQDWTTHSIGHEITALYGLDHAQTLAVIVPGVFEHQRASKRDRLAQYAERVFGVRAGDSDTRARAATQRTEEFFRSIGMQTRFSEYGVGPECADRVAERFVKRAKMGERGDIGPDEVRAIMKLRL